MYKSIIKNSIKSALALLLCAVFIFPLGAQQAYGNSDASANKIVSSWREKIGDELWAEMETKTDTDIIPIWLWLVDTVDHEAINDELRVEKGMDPAIYENSDRFKAEKLPVIISNIQSKTAGPVATNARTTLSMDDAIVRSAVSEMMDEYNLARRAIVKREYKAMNSAFVNKYVNTKSRKIISFSNYTPYIIIEATKQEILAYAKLSEVEDIALFISEELIPCSDESLHQINADENTGTKSNRYNNGTGYKGEDVTVGILEFGGGFFDTSNPQLESIAGNQAKILHRTVNDGEAFVNDYDYNNQAAGDIADHATWVTSIIVGQAIEGNDGNVYEGVAPKAKVYQTKIQLTNNVTTALNDLAQIGCNVINISASMGRDDGYSTWDRAIDRFIINTGIIVVVAAGNIDGENSNRYIPNMAKSVNAITVGNAQKKPDTTVSDSHPFISQKGSSYLDETYLPNKPDLVAPGTSIGVVKRDLNVKFVTGTSFSAPIITGIIAQMMEADPTLKGNGSSKKVKSMLLSATEYSKIESDRDNTAAYIIDDSFVSNYMREVSGAGLVNAAIAVNVARGQNTATSEFLFTSNTSVNSNITSLSAGEKIRLVLTFYRYTETFPTVLGQIDDLKLSLLKSSQNTIVATSDSNKNNVEIIEFTVPKGQGGVYKYKIDVNNLFSSQVYAYVTWLKWRPGDVNGDGITNSLDSSIVLQYGSNLTSLTPEQQFVADVNKDGVVNSLDSSIILQYDANYDVTLL